MNKQTRPVILSQMMVHDSSTSRTTLWQRFNHADGDTVYTINMYDRERDAFASVRLNPDGTYELHSIDQIDWR